MSTREYVKYRVEYRTTVQPLWRDRASVDFDAPDGLYHAETAPLMPPAPAIGVAPWRLHSVQNLPWLGAPKLLVVWEREAPE